MLHELVESQQRRSSGSVWLLTLAALSGDPALHWALLDLWSVVCTEQAEHRLSTSSWSATEIVKGPLAVEANQDHGKPAVLCNSWG